VKKIIFVVRDVKAGCVQGDPMVSFNEATAERSFKVAVNDPELPFCKSPADFQLWKVGEFDPVLGRVTALEPELIIDAVQLLDRVSNREVL